MRESCNGQLMKENERTVSASLLALLRLVLELELVNLAHFLRGGRLLFFCWSGLRRRLFGCGLWRAARLFRGIRRGSSAWRRLWWHRNAREVGVQSLPRRRRRRLGHLNLNRKTTDAQTRENTVHRTASHGTRRSVTAWSSKSMLSFACTYQIELSQRARRRPHWRLDCAAGLKGSHRAASSRFHPIPERRRPLPT